MRKLSLAVGARTSQPPIITLWHRYRPDPKPGARHYDDEKRDTIIAYPYGLDSTHQHIST